MKEFIISIEETLRKAFLVEAETPEEAEMVVRTKYREADIVLTYDDFYDAIICNETDIYEETSVPFLTKFDNKGNEII